MNQQMNIIDLLSIICFFLTIETLDDSKMLEEHLEKQDQKIDKIIEVLKNDNR